KMAGPETVAAEPEAAPVEKTEPEPAATVQAQPEAEEGK
ncbi:MAG: hypothetical protein QG656_2521, partial [Candidatus Hydrogenedentes bacterium]|nr:hypothetical protein [Candidatus Hydrogenedentota bacterium]